MKKNRIKKVITLPLLLFMVAIMFFPILAKANGEIRLTPKYELDEKFNNRLFLEILITSDVEFTSYEFYVQMPYTFRGKDINVDTGTAKLESEHFSVFCEEITPTEYRFHGTRKGGMGAFKDTVNFYLEGSGTGTMKVTSAMLAPYTLSQEIYKGITSFNSPSQIPNLRACWGGELCIEVENLGHVRFLEFDLSLPEGIKVGGIESKANGCDCKQVGNNYHISVSRQNSNYLNLANPILKVNLLGKNTSEAIIGKIENVMCYTEGSLYGTFLNNCHFNVDKRDILVKSVTLENDDLSLYVGDRQHLKATILPTNYTEKLQWISDNEEVANVYDASRGYWVVHALKEGNCRVMAKNESGETLCTAQVTVKKKPVTVVVKDTTRVYGDENPKFEFITENGILEGRPELSCSAMKDSPVGSYCIEAKKGTVTNDEVRFKNATLTVTKAPLVVVVNDYVITQGEELPKFTAIYKGLKNGEDSSVLAKQPIFETTATETSAPGIYTVRAWGVEANNYEVTYYEAGMLTILKRENKKQTITWKQDIKAKVGDSVVMNATASSGLPIKYSYCRYKELASFEIPRIEENKITFPSAGTYMLIAIQDGNKEYEMVADTIDVNVISDDKGLMCIDGIYYKYTDGGSALMVVRGYVPYRGKVVIPSVVNGLPITKIDNQAMYACYYLNEVVIGDNVTWCGNEAFGASINLHKITLPANNLNMDCYLFNCDAAIQEIHCRSSVPYVANESIFNGFVDYDKCILYVPIGTRKSYMSAEVWKNFTNIVETPIVVCAKGYRRVYGDENPIFEYEIKGGTLDGVPEIVCSADKKTGVGTYDIEVRKGTIKNNDVTFVSGTLTITKAPLVATAEDFVITQGNALPKFSATYKGFKNGEDESILKTQPVFETSATEKSEPGEYSIILHGVAADNYEVTSYVTGTLTIKKRELKKQTITWEQDIKAKISSTIEMNATASSGLPVRYSYALVPGVESAYRVPQIEGNNITFPEEGTYMLVAIQDGNDEYAAATDTLDVCAISDEEGLMYIDGIYYKYTDDGSALKVIRGYKPYRGKVEIPATVNGLPVTEVDRLAMYACYYLKELVIGDNVKKCGHEAFGASVNLYNVTLPAGDVELKYNWVFNCDREIREIHCLSSIPYVVDEGIFNGAVDYDKCILYVPFGTKQAYANAEVWKYFTHIVEEEVATGILNVCVSGAKETWYTLQGAKLFGKPRLPGVYIHQGRKVVVR